MTTQVFGRHVAHDTMISGAYKSEFADKKQFDVVAKKVIYGFDLNFCLIRLILNLAEIDRRIGGC